MTARTSDRRIDSESRDEERKDAQRSDSDKDRELNDALRDSFPASDPVAMTQPTAGSTAQRSGSSAKAGDHTREALLKKHDRVNLSDDEDVKYWTERFGVSKAQLSKAVQEAGFFPADVADKLGKTL